MPRPNPKTSRERIGRAKHATEVMKLRLQGLSFRQIAEQLGLSDSRVYTICTQELDRLNKIRAETVEQVQRLEVARLDDLLQAHWEKARAGDFASTDRVLAIMNRRSKLLGLDLADKNAPPQSGPLVLNISEVVINNREALNGEQQARIGVDESGAASPGSNPVPAE